MLKNTSHIRHFALLLFGLIILGALSSCGGCKSGYDYDKNPTILYLVRHAEKAQDGTSDPPLTEEGKARSERLAELLHDKEIDFIFSTDFIRTQETARPLAEKLGKNIQSYNHKDFSTLLAFIKENAGSKILIVGHSNSTPSLINTILGKNKWPKIDESIYTHIYTVIYRGKDSDVTLNSF